MAVLNDTLLSAFVRVVRGSFATVTLQKGFLESLQTRALIGTTTGVAEVLDNLQDYQTVNLSNAQRSTQFLRGMSPAAVAELCEAAIQRIEADEAAGGVGKADTSGAVHSDFSTRYSQLG